MYSCLHLFICRWALRLLPLLGHIVAHAARAGGTGSWASLFVRSRTDTQQNLLKRIASLACFQHYCSVSPLVSWSLRPPAEVLPSLALADPSKLTPV